MVPIVFGLLCVAHLIAQRRLTNQGGKLSSTHGEVSLPRYEFSFATTSLSIPHMPPYPVAQDASTSVSIGEEHLPPYDHNHSAIAVAASAHHTGTTHSTTTDTTLSTS
ncbi:hypothetical protein BJ742DRAFT_538871 [Cladochytrium replicatum]|nr:hypothetical protein BJ742DRAFT_538871 [Cladochytrium replicatum]